MKIIADENIPLVERAFGALGEVCTLPGRAITPQAVRDADALLVRSITAVDGPLLDGSSVRFVATATIGTDHVDEAYLAGRGIGFASAPGSNANSVAEYVVAALLTWAHRRERTLSGMTLGVVGVGHVGGKVAAKARAMGMTVLCNDPPLKRAGAPGSAGFIELDELVRAADAVTFHVPLACAGDDPTMHMIDATLLGRMKLDALLINTSRGAVHDSAGVLAAQDARRAQDLPAHDLVLDVWENEPTIDLALVEQCLIATPHVAGYSLDGKVAGTMMIYQAACRHFGVQPAWTVPDDLPGAAHPLIEVESAGLSDQEILRQVVRHAYDIEWDDATLRGIGDQPAERQGAYFDALRRQYPVRREFSAGRVRPADQRPRAAEMLRGLGFDVAE